MGSARIPGPLQSRQVPVMLSKAVPTLLGSISGSDHRSNGLLQRFFASAALRLRMTVALVKGPCNRPAGLPRVIAFDRRLSPIPPSPFPLSGRSPSATEGGETIFGGAQAAEPPALLQTSKSPRGWRQDVSMAKHRSQVRLCWRLRRLTPARPRRRRDPRRPGCPPSRASRRGSPAPARPRPAE